MQKRLIDGKKRLTEGMRTRIEQVEEASWRIERGYQPKFEWGVAYKNHFVFMQQCPLHGQGFLQQQQQAWNQYQSGWSNPCLGGLLFGLGSSGRY